MSQCACGQPRDPNATYRDRARCADCARKAVEARLARSASRRAELAAARGYPPTTGPTGRSRRAEDGRPSAVDETNTDLDQAALELDRARDELSAMPNGLTRAQRDAYLADPLSRLELVRRFIVEALERHGWSGANEMEAA